MSTEGRGADIEREREGGEGWPHEGWPHRGNPPSLVLLLKRERAPPPDNFPSCRISNTGTYYRNHPLPTSGIISRLLLVGCSSLSFSLTHVFPPISDTTAILLNYNPYGLTIGENGTFVTIVVTDSHAHAASDIASIDAHTRYICVIHNPDVVFNKLKRVNGHE